LPFTNHERDLIPRKLRISMCLTFNSFPQVNGFKESE
jgi:hypothetical protein